MEGKCLYEVFVLPVTFKTVSFHHRSHYTIKFYPANLDAVRSMAITPDFAVTKKIVDKNTGNIIGVGANLGKDNVLITERFPIDYNEQSVKFTTGMWLQVASEETKTLEIVIELYRIDLDRMKDGKIQHILNPEEKKVADELLYITLDPAKTEQHYSYRKLIFPTCEYISFIDLGCVSTKIGKPLDFSKIKYDGQVCVQQSSLIDCCLIYKDIVDPEGFLRQIYTVAIVEKLEAYQCIAKLLKEKIKEYKIRLRTKKYTMRTSKQWEEKWVKREVANLRYVKVEEQKVEEQGLFESCLPMNRSQPKQLSWILCYHYNCEVQQLAVHISSQSWMIECNIRAAFRRCIEIMAILAEGAALEIAAHEKKRVMEFLQIGRTEKEYSAEECLKQEQFDEYKTKIAKKLSNLSNYSILQERQPLIMVSGEDKAGIRLDISRTVTILVHGFRGTEFDLSKIKSYLNLFLGFNHFYAVRSIATGEGTNASISKLGELAGQEVNKYLELHSGIRFVNIVGFSLGGVIARSMLRHLKDHEKKLNLLLTLASPHLGMREIQSCLVRAGLFYMRRVAKVESIQDLNNQRTADRSRFLQELANSEYINMFRWVILVGCSEDDYVPSYSSLCNYKGEDETIRSLCEGFNQQRSGVIRCNVKLQVKQNLMDLLTRRKIHISLLEDDSFIRMLVVRFQHYFTHTR